MKKKVVIIGCGFAGIKLAEKLNKSTYDVLLVDKRNYHTFQPLLYQVATGGLEPRNIAYPVRRIIRGYPNVRFQMSKIEKINIKEKKLITTMGEIKYDILVVATGSRNNFFNFEDRKNMLLTLKSVKNALNVRSFLMQNFEEAEVSFDEEKTRELLNVGIIGGGPTGVELAGALAEMRKYNLPKDFPNIDFSKMSINIFESAPRLLANMSEKSSANTYKYLKKLGVNIFINSKVINFDEHKIYMADGSSFLTDTILWTAGVKGRIFEGFDPKYISKSNRIMVDEYNRSFEDENIYVIGDVAEMNNGKNPKGHPQVAPVAIQQAITLAKNLRALEFNYPLTKFEYKDKGSMSTIGRNKAVVELWGLNFHGFFAWVLWMFVHLISIVGFRNKLLTFIDWVINYFNYDKPLGLIIRAYTRTINATKINK